MNPLATKNDSIAHAIAYVNVFMNNPSVEGNELNAILEHANTLSPTNIVSIIKESAKCSGLCGSDIVIQEMDNPEFHKFISRAVHNKRLAS